MAKIYFIQRWIFTNISVNDFAGSKSTQNLNGFLASQLKPGFSVSIQQREFHRSKSKIEIYVKAGNFVRIKVVQQVN